MMCSITWFVWNEWIFLFVFANLQLGCKIMNGFHVLGVSGSTLLYDVEMLVCILN